MIKKIQTPCAVCDEIYFVIFRDIGDMSGRCNACGYTFEVNSSGTDYFIGGRRFHRPPTPLFEDENYDRYISFVCKAIEIERKRLTARVRVPWLRAGF